MIKAQKGMQEEVLKSDSDFILIGASRGSGMTTAMLLHAKQNVEKGDYLAAFWTNDKWVKKAAVDITREEWFSGRSYGFIQFDHPTEEYGNIGMMCFADYDKNLCEPDCIYIEDITSKSEQVEKALRCDDCKIVASCYIDRQSWLGKWMRDYQLYDGKKRYMHIGDNISKVIFGDTKEELINMSFPSADIKSFQYITSDLCENRALIESDPSYLANILSETGDAPENLFEGSWV